MASTLPTPIAQRPAASINNSATKVRLHDQQVTALKSKTLKHDTQIATTNATVATQATTITSQASTITSQAAAITTLQSQVAVLSAAINVIVNQPGYNNPNISIMAHVSTNSTTPTQVQDNLNLLMNRLIGANLMRS